MKYLTIFLLLIKFDAYSQALSVPGQILDMRNNPVSLATISVVGENATSTTDDSGVFSLKIPANVKKGDVITIRVYKQGYKLASRHIPVSPLMVTIRLTKNNNSNRIPEHVTKNHAQTDVKEAEPETNSSTILGNQHIISGSGNTVGVNGDVNINPEKHFSDVDKSNLLEFIRTIEVKYDFHPTCFQIGVTNNTNGAKVALEIESFMKSQGYQIRSESYPTVFSENPILGVSVNRLGDCLNIVVGIL